MGHWTSQRKSHSSASEVLLLLVKTPEVPPSQVAEGVGCLQDANTSLQMLNSPAREGPPRSLWGQPREDPAHGYSLLPEKSPKHGKFHCWSIQPLSAIRPQRHYINSQKKKAQRETQRVTWASETRCKTVTMQPTLSQHFIIRGLEITYVGWYSQEGNVKSCSGVNVSRFILRHIKKHKHRPLLSLSHCWARVAAHVRAISLTAETHPSFGTGRPAGVTH